MVKALAPNFFARGDTRTPVKYSIVVLFTNLAFSLLLMKPFGHVGIAAATTIAAFVSLYQYCRGLKKRGYWQFSEELRCKIYKIIASSLVMGGVLWLGTTVFDILLDGWLRQALLIKLGIFGFLCVLGVASFGIMTKITGVLDTAEIRRLLSRKGKKDAKNTA